MSFLSFPDGYTMDDIVLYWLNDKDAVSGVDDVSLPQFSISDYDTINKVEGLLTGKVWHRYYSHKQQKKIDCENPICHMKLFKSKLAYIRLSSVFLRLNFTILFPELLAL